MGDLGGKVLFITGASRGIGLAIARRAAQDGAAVVLAAKTTEAHPKLPGTIYTAAAEVEAAGGEALPLPLDIRDDAAVETAMAGAIERFGRLDILVNNASAIYLAGTAATPLKRFDLMFGVNVRGTYACSRAALPHLTQASNPHILNLSPPLSMRAKWFENHVAYTMSTYGMSMCVLGMAAELRAQGIAVNALWPRTVIATAALAMVGEIDFTHCRRSEIVADAAHWILTRPSRDCTGRFFVDEEVLRGAGVSDFDRYAVAPGQPLLPDFFLDEESA